MRRLFRSVGVFLLLVALLAGVLWTVRIPIASAWLTERFERRGFPEANFEITRLGLYRTIIGSVRLGPAPAPTVDWITIDYDPLRLLEGDRTHVVVRLSGVRARGEFDADGPRVLGWPAAADAGVTVPSADGPTAMPGLRVRDARLEIASTLGRWQLDIDGHLDGGAAGPQAGRFDLALSNTRLHLEGSLAADYDGQRIKGSGRIVEDDGFTVRVETEVADPGGRSEVNLQYALDMPSRADLPWALLPGAPPASGHAQITGSASGALGSLSWPGDARALLDRLVAGGWHGDYRIRVNALALNARFDDLDVDAAGQWRQSTDGLTLSVDGAGALRLGRVARPLWSRAAPAWTEPYAGGPIEVTWEGGDWVHAEAAPDGAGIDLSGLPRLRLEWPEQRGHASLAARFEARVNADLRPQALSLPEATVTANRIALPGVAIDRIALLGGVDSVLDAPRGELDLSVDMAELDRFGIRASDLALRLPLRVEAGDEYTRLRLRSNGHLRASTVTLPGGLHTTDSPGAEITAGTLRLGESPSFSVRLGIDSTWLAGVSDAQSGAAITLGPGTLALEGDARTGALRQITLTDFTAAAPTRNLRAAGIAARLRPGGREDWLSFDVARLRETADDTIAPPARFEGTVACQPGEALILSGRGNAPAAFTFAGRADLSSPERQFEISFEDGSTALKLDGGARRIVSEFLTVSLGYSGRAATCGPAGEG